MVKRVKDTAPLRLPIGDRKKTVPFYTKDFYGNPDDYDFRRQTSQYQALRATLADLNLVFNNMGAYNITPIRAHFTLYVGDPESPLVIWEKYEGKSAAGGQNRLFLRGQVFKMAEFMALDDEGRKRMIEPCELRLLMRQTATTEGRQQQNGKR